MTSKTFPQKIQAAQTIVGGIHNLFAELRARKAYASVTSLLRWVQGKGEPHPNNRAIVERALDEILAMKKGDQ